MSKHIPYEAILAALERLKLDRDGRDTTDAHNAALAKAMEAVRGLGA